MSAQNQLVYTAFRTFNGMAPKDKSKALYIPLDFTASGSNGAAIAIDLEIAKQMAWLEFVQSIFVDNTANATMNFAITCGISQQTLTIAGGKQAYLPILAPSSAKYTTTISAVPTGLVKVQFLNFPVPAIVW